MTELKTELKALIFDVDGTLAETERDAHRVAFNQAFAEAGLDWHWSVERYGDLIEVAGGKERIQFYLKTDCPGFEPATDIPVWAAGLHRAKTQYYRQLVQTGAIPLRPGVKRLIQEAQAAGIRLAIATTSALDNVLALLETTLGAESPTWFEVIAAGDVVPAKKPAPDIYLYALEALQLPPQECLAIEDSHQGLRSALQAHLKTIITCNGYTQSQDFSGASLVLNHLGEPELPCEAIAGCALNSAYFDLALARKIIQMDA